MNSTKSVREELAEKLKALVKSTGHFILPFDLPVLMLINPNKKLTTDEMIQKLSDAQVEQALARLRITN